MPRRRPGVETFHFMAPRSGCTSAELLRRNVDNLAVPSNQEQQAAKAAFEAAMAERRVNTAYLEAMRNELRARAARNSVRGPVHAKCVP